MAATGHNSAMRFLPCALIALLAGCATSPTPPSPSTPSTAPRDGALPVVNEAWRSVPVAGHELDSLAVWPTPDGATWVLATDKHGDQVLVFDADTGAALHAFGGPGSAPGDFDRPNGISVQGDLAFVVERDNRRVQVFSLPEMTPRLVFGTPELRSPYGLWVHEVAPDTVEVYVTDSFMDPPAHTGVPAFDTLDQRVRRYRVAQAEDGALSAQLIGSFGATDPAQALRIVESIAGDPAHDRLLIADEDLRHHATLHDYRLDGRPRGRTLAPGTFGGEPEGVALWACTVDDGYWVAADQLRPLTVFHLFDRQTLAPAGRFTGAATAHTDGIALYPVPTARFPYGALFAVNDDAEVVAFDLRDVAAAVRLDHDCTD